MIDVIAFLFSVFALSLLTGAAIGWAVSEIYYTIRARIRAKRSSKMTRADEFNDPRR